MYISIRRHHACMHACKEEEGEGEEERGDILIVIIQG
jgi:hypothetical protein